MEGSGLTLKVSGAFGQRKRTLRAPRGACCFLDFAVGQNRWYHFAVGAEPILVYFNVDWDVHWGHDFDFDPWPFVSGVKKDRRRTTRLFGRPREDQGKTLMSFKCPKAFLLFRVLCWRREGMGFSGKVSCIMLVFSGP